MFQPAHRLHSTAASFFYRLLILFPVFAGTAALCFYFIDYPLLYFLDQTLPAELLTVMRFLTEIGNGNVAAAVIIGFFLVWIWYRRRPGYSNPGDKVHRLAQVTLNRAVLLFWALILGGLNVNIIKFLVGRVRPETYMSKGGEQFVPLSYSTHFFSFPSGHTQTVFGLAFCLGLYFPKYRLVFWLLALFGGVSRVMVLKHYPADVIMGCYVGLLTAAAVYLRREKYPVVTSLSA